MKIDKAYRLETEQRGNHMVVMANHNEGDQRHGKWTLDCATLRRIVDTALNFDRPIVSKPIRRTNKLTKRYCEYLENNLLTGQVENLLENSSTKHVK
jgi:hypothetical protein